VCFVEVVASVIRGSRRTVVYSCSKCGVETDWDISLGPNPLCAVCWDSEADVLTPAERKALYREAHKAENREYSRRYRESHRAEIRAYRVAHKEEHKRYRNEYYRTHLEFRERMKEYQCGYYRANREKVLSREREHRRCRSGQLVVAV
jgi:hypothetical protein